MPKSHVRKKKVYTPPAEFRPETTAAARRPSGAWVPILGVTLVALGIAWLVIFYLTSGFYDFEALAPLAKLRYWNLGIGFGAIVASLIVFTKWR